jgi:hypothetical protein
MMHTGCIWILFCTCSSRMCCGLTLMLAFWYFDFLLGYIGPIPCGWMVLLSKPANSEMFRALSSVPRISLSSPYLPTYLSLLSVLILFSLALIPCPCSILSDRLLSRACMFYSLKATTGWFTTSGLRRVGRWMIPLRAAARVPDWGARGYQTRERLASG